MKADLFIEGGSIYTMDELRPKANALAVCDGLILGIGEREDLKPLIGNDTQIISLNGEMVLPGFIESHGHLLSMGQVHRRPNMTGLTSIESIVELLKAKQLEYAQGDWICGRGWDQHLWDNDVFPNKEDLVGCGEQNPLYLTRVDGHAAWVNQLALKLAGIHRETPDPAGGSIVRNSSGEPTGVLIDTAMELVQDILPLDSAHIMGLDMQTAIGECHRKGITSFHDAFTTRQMLPVFDRLRETQNFRLYTMCAGSDLDFCQNLFERGIQQNAWLNIRAIKLFADGALGSCGAHLKSPYANSDQTGLSLIETEQMQEIVTQAHAAGFQVCTHAIGDQANFKTLNVYAKVLKHRPMCDHRFRIEHAQLLDPKDVPRFSQLGVIASMQAIHLSTDMHFADKLLGKKRAREHAFVWRSLLDHGTVIAGGSDAPIEPVDPMFGLYTSVTRRSITHTDSAPWNVHQAMKRVEALRSFTTGGAFASFEECEKGKLSAGYYADLVILDRDLMQVSEDEIKQVKVVGTMVGGQLVYQG